MSDLNTLYNTLSDCVIEISHVIRKFNPISLGSTVGSENSSGEQVKKLDLLCNNLLIEKLSQLSCVKCIASEEEEELIKVNENGKYLVSFDPLDGSSNIDCNITVGTIFCVFEYKNNTLINGSNIVMSGYSLYGGSTQLTVCKDKVTTMYNLNPENKKPIILIGGLNGHGKTTLLEALQIGFFGRKLTDIYQSKNQKYLINWQSNISHVPQNIYLADSTIAENIALGTKKKDIDICRVMQAAKQAQISTFYEI